MCYYRVTLLKPCETHATSPSSALQCFAAEELQIFFIFLSFKNVTLCGTLSTTFYTLWKKCLNVLTNRHTIDTVLVKCENTYLPLEITDLATCSFFISSDLPAPTPVSEWVGHTKTSRDIWSGHMLIFWMVRPINVATQRDILGQMWKHTSNTSI